MSNEELALQYQQGDTAALFPLWEQVVALAVKLIKPYLGLAHRNRAVDFDDLMQAAFLAVERTASAYREGEGSFTTVMGYYIKSECAALLGLRGRKRTEIYESVSASTPLGEDTNTTIMDTIPDDSLPEHSEGMEREAVRQEVQAAIARLPGDQAAIVRGYYLDGQSCPVLAAQAGMTRGQVDRIRLRGHRGLRRDKRLQELMDEYDELDAVCFRHRGVAAFQRTWMSSTEAAALAMLGWR